MYAGASSLHVAVKEFNDAVKRAIADGETKLDGVDGYVQRIRSELREVLEAQGRYLEEHGIAAPAAAPAISSR